MFFWQGLQNLRVIIKLKKCYRKQKGTSEDTWWIGGLSKLR